MDSSPALKRRKLNSSVNKPFKSPMRTSLKSGANPPTPSPLSSAPVKSSSEESKDTEKPKVLQATPLKRFSQPLNRTNSPSSAPSDPETLQAIQAISKQIRTTESNLIKARQDIDTLSQAVSLLTSTKDVELEALATKWRYAARNAAEEVFAGARDRVNRMGGVGAWREREREMKEFQQGWDQPEKRSGGSDDEGEEIDEREERFEEEWEYDREIREEKEKDDVGRDDDSFTMDMMLKMMNIELSVIGYDKKRQRWIG